MRLEEKVHRVVTRTENVLNEFLIVLLELVTAIAVLSAVSISLVSEPSGLLVESLLKIKFIGNSIFNWVVMLALIIIAREAWMIKKRRSW